MSAPKFGAENVSQELALLADLDFSKPVNEELQLVSAGWPLN
jgi:hypothetical protein